MTIKLYNTLTRQKEAFEPIDPDNVRMYVCGPTVYDYAHIGNARPVIVFDVLFRLLRHVYGENHVTYVRNITDVDDKINARALETHGEAIAAGTMSLNEAIREVTEKTANQFQSDMTALGSLEPTHQPRATDFILPREDGKADMVSMIQTLIDKGHAYVSKGEKGREVLFRVKSMADYGALSKRKLDEQQAGARVAVEGHKEDAADFVLWKESSETEPGWDGTFDGQTIHGRPGWHIECSAMSEAYLGKTFDIHGGGLDLIFPHHENELAQSRCCHGTDVMANVWMHNGFLQIEGQKMSKSLGNFHTVHDVLETEKVGGFAWPGSVARWAMLSTNYREPINFTVKKLEEASNELSKFKLACDWAEAGAPPRRLIDCLGNDLNLQSAITELRRLAKRVAGPPAVEIIDDKFPDATSNLDNASSNASALRSGLEFLGVNIDDFDPDWLSKGRSETSQKDIEKVISQRLAFIAEKNWAEADRIRDELLSQGIQLKDSKDSETGERITTWEVKR